MFAATDDVRDKEETGIDVDISVEVRASITVASSSGLWMMLGSMVGAVSLIMGLGAVSLILKDKVSLQFNLFPMIKNASDQIPIHMHIHAQPYNYNYGMLSDCYACVDIRMHNKY